MSVRFLNRAQLIGNLTADPVMRTTSNGTPVITFAVATNRSYTDSSGAQQESAEFHNIVAFGKVAKICEQFLQKGSMIFVEGRIQTRKSDSEDGHTNYKTEIVVDDMKLLARGKAPSGSYNDSSYVDSNSSSSVPIDDNSANSDGDNKKKTKKTKKEEAPSEEVTAEDIPF